MSTTKLKILLKGPAVEKNRIKLNDFILLTENLQKAILNIAESLAGIVKIKPGRHKKNLEESCQLELLQIFPGSLGIELELYQPKMQPSFLPTYGEKALKVFLDDFRKFEKKPESLPDHFTEPVLKHIIEIGKIFKSGIEQIRFDGIMKDTKLEANYSLTVYNKIIKLTSKKKEITTVEIIGILWEADWKDHTAELYDNLGQKILVKFDQDFDDQIKLAAKNRVKISGKGTLENGMIKEIKLNNIKIIEEEGAFKVSESISLKEPSFQKTSEDPFKNAKPLKDFSIFENMPDDWDVDGFIEEIYHLREEDKD